MNTVRELSPQMNAVLVSTDGTEQIIYSGTADKATKCIEYARTWFDRSTIDHSKSAYVAVRLADGSPPITLLMFSPI